MHATLIKVEFYYIRLLLEENSGLKKSACLWQNFQTCILFERKAKAYQVLKLWWFDQICKSDVYCQGTLSQGRTWHFLIFCLSSQLTCSGLAYSLSTVVEQLILNSEFAGSKPAGRGTFLLCYCLTLFCPNPWVCLSITWKC